MARTLRKVTGTDSCAAAATKAATLMLLSGGKIKKISYMDPNGQEVFIVVEDVCAEEGSVSCAVRLDSGSDPDIAKDILIYSKVKKAEKGILVEGGEGIGKADEQVYGLEEGKKAIDEKAMEAIKSSALYICEEIDYKEGIEVEIYAPLGKSVAKRKGISGGIAILGGSAVVSPMNASQTKRSIQLAIKSMAMKYEYLAASPGNNGEIFAKEEFNIPEDRIIRSSDYIGDTIAFCLHSKVKGLVLIGHIGKMVKLGAGILNTHNKSGDGRLEVLVTAAIKAGASSALLSDIVNCITIDEALDLLEEAGILEPAMQALIEKIERHITRNSSDMEIGAVVFSNHYGILALTSKAVELINNVNLQQEQDRSDILRN
ncbi:MAG: cobalamin biosynthesis protein CbiD [Firmicutes bacterium]|nr:cobalamin biosynthesis protein CbiD [Bacillota bacterium]